MKRCSIILFTMFVIGCNSSVKHKQTVDLEKQKKALLAMHKKDREAHFKNDAKALLQGSLDSFIYVGNGAISITATKDDLPGFSEYLRNATYSHWDDMQPPIIRISDDGTLAWMITRLNVKRVKTDSAGNKKSEGFIYAGIMTYKKAGDKWLREANVSTFEESK